MSTIHGIWKDGHFVPTRPVDLPDGTEVVLRLASDYDGEGDPSLIGDDPESIARWMAWIDSLKPLEFTPEEEAEIKRLRDEARDWDKAGFDERADRLSKQFN